MVSTSGTSGTVFQDSYYSSPSTYTRIIRQGEYRRSSGKQSLDHDASYETGQLVVSPSDIYRTLARKSKCQPR